MISVYALIPTGEPGVTLVERLGVTRYETRIPLAEAIALRDRLTEALAEIVTRNSGVSL